LAISGFVFHSLKLLKAELALSKPKMSEKRRPFTLQAEIFPELVQRRYSLLSRSLDRRDLEGVKGGMDTASARHSRRTFSRILQNFCEVVVAKSA
jgi:hypothetical protein